MTEIIYHSDSIGKIVSVFAIECAIVFGFIIICTCCFTGKLFSSKDTNIDKNEFAFVKYSNYNKISKEQIDKLYVKTIGVNEQSNLIDVSTKTEKTAKNTNTFCSLNFSNCFKSKKQKQNSVLENIKKTEENEKNEENKEDKENNFDIEKGVNPLDKIYIVYEFNNLDKSTNHTKSYVETESKDEFDELEEFVNMIIKSFSDKYEQVGVLLKICSPGGSAFKFENAYLNLLRLKDKKIELIGMVDKMAASGGYMLASACDKIISSKYATIGSIGVIAQMYNWSELNKKVGLEEKTWTTGSHKNPFPTGTSYTEEDDVRMKEMVGETFDIFKSIVMESRKFNDEQMEQILKAKTFPGLKALELNMVDELGMVDDYLDKLCETNNIWICKKKTNSKSFISTLLMKNITSFGVNLFEKFYNQLMIDKKTNCVKLM